MEGREPESKYLILWLCVIICAGIIFVGWLISMKYNFDKINRETEKNVNRTNDQAFQEVQEMFEGADKILKQGEEELTIIKELKKDKDAEEKPVVNEPNPEPVKQLP